MAETTCSNCRFFRMVSKTPPIKGECHYNPPISGSVFHQGDQISSRVAVWPLVRDVDFCSKFEEGQAPAMKAMPKAVPTPEIV